MLKMIAIMILNIIFLCILIIATAVMAIAAAFYSIAVDSMASFAHCTPYDNKCYCDGKTYSKFFNSLKHCDGE